MIKEMQKINMLKVSKFQLLATVLGILLFLTLINYRYILLALGLEADLAFVDISVRQIFNTYTDTYLALPALASITTGIVWGFVGTVVYMLGWLGWRLISDMSNNFEFATSYRHPKGFNKTTYAGLLVRDMALRSLFSFLMIVDLAVFLLVSLELGAQGFRIFIFHPLSLEGWISLGLATLLLLVHCYVFIVTTRLLRRPFPL